MGCGKSVPVHTYGEKSAPTNPASDPAASEHPSEAEDQVTVISSQPAPRHAARRLSLAGGPVGAKGISPGDDARRRRLTISVTTGGAAREVALDNAKIVDPNKDPNMPLIRLANAAALPVRWCEYSRPGNDPLKRAKDNQDSCAVIDGFADRADQLFIGVCDGHGPNGGHASKFIIRRLAEAWAEHPELLSGAEGGEGEGKEGGDGEGEGPFEAMHAGCLRANRDLSASGTDVYVSGTTGVTALLRGRRLFVANVGDSRAVLGRDAEGGGGKIVALDLSNDQKPDRPDEKSRIESLGGRVFEWGVPRVWLKDVDMPGLAMARSYGDEAAESVGVFAEPELSEVSLGATDRFAIWASDGVWEFISSQEAVDIVASHWRAAMAEAKGAPEGGSIGSPLKAAAALVKESVKRWREEEDVIDDITAIVMFMNYT